jgi:hypothetical protein
VQPIEWETVSGTIGWTRVNFFVPSHNRIPSIHFADAAPEITDQFVERFIFRLRWQVSVEVAHEADPKRDIIEIVAMYVSAVELPGPPVPDLDLTVPGGGTVADDEVISQTVWHPANVPVIIIEDTSVPLPGPAVVYDDIFPSVASDTGIVDSLANGWSKILPPDVSTAGCRDHVFLCFGT